MSRQGSEASEVEVTASGQHWWRRVSVLAALTVVTGLAACGGDDDHAADSTSAPVTTADVTTTLPSEITQPTESTEVPGSVPAPDPGPSESAPAGDPQPATAETSAVASDPTEAPEATVSAITETTDGSASGGGTGGSRSGAGPTTTGPECAFAENTSLPLQRCDMGPAVGVVQSILQANGYEVGIDGMFGDQTLYAVRAFQKDEGLAVDGIVGLQTWTALGVGEVYPGTDDDGDGVIEPHELDLAG